MFISCVACLCYIKHQLFSFSGKKWFHYLNGNTGMIYHFKLLDCPSVGISTPRSGKQFVAMFDFSQVILAPSFRPSFLTFYVMVTSFPLLLFFSFFLVFCYLFVSTLLFSFLFSSPLILPPLLSPPPFIALLCSPLPSCCMLCPYRFR